jgi:hypothetical protein
VTRSDYGFRIAGIFLTALCFAPIAAKADRIANPIAVFAGLDKITGVTTTFEVKIGEEVKFGGFLVRPRVCYSRLPTEEPKTTSFVEVDELETDQSHKRVFTGWMFAESPGLNAVEHPVYDVWLTGCRDPDAPPPIIEAAPETAPAGEEEEDLPDD